MSTRKPTRKVAWTEADRARHRALREKFRDWHPSPEEVIASGEAARFQLLGEFRGLRPFLEGLKRAREAAGLTLAAVSRRCGLDQPALSRLENGHNRNPTLETLWKYAAAVGKQLVLSADDLETTGGPDGTPRGGSRRRRAER
jgi:DNA-binding XRE family transcriptional regulator